MSNGISDQERRLDRLQRSGVQIEDPRQTFIAGDVDLDRIFPGAYIHAGARLSGRDLLLAPHSRIGSEGPVVVCNAIVGPGAEIASGFVSGAVLLDNARLGANAHVRPGTILEEEASTAHAVGLKHTILMSYVTTGSMVNLCDVLVSGGTSATHFSEIGSGFVHFNYTPWGEAGDKATPTMVGDVTNGVFLDQERTFLGGLSGIVGPKSIGFGSLVSAGSIVRADVEAGVLYSSIGRDSIAALDCSARFSEHKLLKNRQYLANLFALLNWYSHVRLPVAKQREDAEVAVKVVQGGTLTILSSVEERLKRLNAYLNQFGRRSAGISLETIPFDRGLLHLSPQRRFDDWVKNLSIGDRHALRAWLRSCADRVMEASREW